ncbi:zf-HC2 domain-containing protein [Anaerovorax odorimutans]|uniref:zf-HC2 domain-containing protein n=1 Tax=Anaerovorax odorimutans TaxID=109327 RepID=UPI0003FC4A16|nr:zf-HC2 domain-containing protein [Anaerovorax odorimutans]
MKIDCDIIKDLLPLYVDGVCSQKSKEMIEKHINECPLCKEELKLMHQELPFNPIEKNLNEAESVKKISKEWKKGMFKSLIEGILITCVFALILFIFFDIKIS